MMEARSSSDSEHVSIPNSSLEHPITTDGLFHLNRKTSKISIKANVPLSVSRSSSVADSANVPSFRPHSREKSSNYVRSSRSNLRNSIPTESPHESPLLNRSKLSVPHESIPTRTTDQTPARGTPVSARRDEGPDPHPLWYRTQTFSHRYGASGGRESLLSPPLRSNTLPIELPSRKSEHEVTSNGLPPLLRGTPSTLPSLSPAQNERESFPQQPRLNVRVPELVSIDVPAASERTREPQDRIEKHPVLDTPPSKPGFASDRRRDGVIKGHVPGEADSSAPNVLKIDQRPFNQPRPTLPIAVPNSSMSPQLDASSSPRILRPSSPPLQHDIGNLSLPLATIELRAPGVRTHVPRNVLTISPNAQDYGQLMDRLATHMPHLINVREEDCRNYRSGQIYCYDALESGGFPRLFGNISFPNELYGPHLLKKVQNLRTDRVRNVRARYILVEDISPQLITNLGTTFWLNPEFFEEHLNQSGYRASSYEDPSPRTWNTNATPKDYASVRWFRPVHRSKVRPLSQLDRQTLLGLGDSTGVLRYEISSAQSWIEKTVRLTTNIFRAEWAIVSDPDRAVPEEGVGTFPVAWEERLTVQVSESPLRPPICE
jgi:hypothetical protein